MQSKYYTAKSLINYRGREYNRIYFDGKHLIDIRRKKLSLKYFIMGDGLVLGMFEGNRGEKPSWDFTLKFLEPGAKRQLRTPQHLHWVVDLLLKMKTYKKEVCQIISFYHNYYYNVKPYLSKSDKTKYNPFTPIKMTKKYSKINHKGIYTIEYISYLIELFAIREKTSPRKNNIVENLLNCLLDYCEGKQDFYNLLCRTKA